MAVTPSYKGFEPSSETASRIKKRNRKSGGKAETILRKELWRRGLRYLVHVNNLPGTPDIVFKSRRVAIFVDGDFWHGRDWSLRQDKLRQSKNSAYWLAKISYNIERDQRVSAELRSSGWVVLRLWEGEIFLDCESAVLRIVELTQDLPSRRRL
jgi:DNA mismatch endonuclease (patch repair protein)